MSGKLQSQNFAVELTTSMINIPYFGGGGDLFHREIYKHFPFSTVYNSTLYTLYSLHQALSALIQFLHISISERGIDFVNRRGAL